MGLEESHTLSEQLLLLVVHGRRPPHGQSLGTGEIVRIVIILRDRLYSLGEVLGICTGEMVITC